MPSSIIKGYQGACLPLESGKVASAVFRPHPETTLFRNIPVRQIVAVLLIVAVVIGILLVISLERQRFVFSGLTEGKPLSAELDVALGQSQRDLIAITILLFLVGGIGISAVVTYLNYRNTRQTLEQVKGLARHILQGIPTGILTINRDGIVTALNPAAESILRKDSQVLLGTHYETMFAEGNPIHNILSKTLEEGIPVKHKEVSLRTHNDLTRTIRITSATLSEDDGHHAGYIFQIEDISEELVKERQLANAQKLTALHTLSAGVAHELRNPLSALDLNLHLLKEELQEQKILFPRAEQYIEILATEIKRLSHILDSIMSYAQARSENIQEVDLPKVMDHLKHLLEQEAQKRGQRFEVDVSEHVSTISCDETQLTQAIFNIVLNAFQAMPEGGLCRMTVGASHSIDGSMIEIIIQDTGPGIPESALSHIFDPFFSTKPKGSGLGLAIAHRIMTNHGGTIDVSSSIGQGTTVTLRLPATPQATLRTVETR